MNLQVIRRRFTVEEYSRMAEAGILTEDDRVELIEGEVVEMPPIGSEHAEAVDRLTELLVRRFGDVARVRVQNPIHLGNYSEPQPDVALVRRRPETYAARHPEAQDIFLVIEVAESSVAFDRQVKMPLYSRSGIAEYWLIDIEERTITVYLEPAAGGYHTSRTLRPGDRLAPQAFPDRELTATDLLGEK